jgi:hypothetical protein
MSKSRPKGDAGDKEHLDSIPLSGDEENQGIRQRRLILLGRDERAQIKRNALNAALGKPSFYLQIFMTCATLTVAQPTQTAYQERHDWLQQHLMQRHLIGVAVRVIQIIH